MATHEFRIDDISGNTNEADLSSVVLALGRIDPAARVLLACCVTYASAAKGGRVFPRVWSPMSDHRVYYTVDRLAMPDPGKINHPCEIASHGLVHADHRLMCKGAQEMSILLSCSLLNSRVFVPPFNYWNAATEELCEVHGIELVKFEDGWRNAKFTPYDPAHRRYYFHAWEWTAETVAEWAG